jgi:hemin uptake protein HemP
MSHPPPSSIDRPATPVIPQPRRILVSDLLAGEDLVVLLHNGQEYRLRVTRANKLILTK